MELSPGCDLCADTGTLRLLAACHPAAPLRVELSEDGVMELFCYIPECGRDVARFKVEDFVEGEWQCPVCGLRRSASVAEPPLCLRDGAITHPLTWRDAAAEAGEITARAMKRVEAMEQSWPEGYSMPVSEESDGF